MAPLVQADRVVVRRGDRAVLDGTSATIDVGDRVGIVGRNGAGKSTLLGVLAGVVEPEAGRVVRSTGVRVRHVGQGDALPPGTVAQAVLGDAPEHEWAADPRAREVLDGLLGGAGSALLAADTATLSGGEARRAALARALVGEWDLLLLDEPTNHLDLRSVTWLAEYLLALPKRRALAVVTHDRWFLDEVTDRTWEVHDGVVDAYDGGYAAYVLARAERDRQAAASEARRLNLVRKELAWLRRGPPARTSKPKFRIDAANALIADEPPARDSVRLSAVASARLGKKVLELRGATLRPAPDAPAVLTDLTWGLGPGDRVGILGDNGAGKTTLLRLVVDEDPPDVSGVVDRGTTVVAGQLAQRLPATDGDTRVLPWLQEVGNRVQVDSGEDLTPGQLLERFGFSPDVGWKRLGDLSGGELRRLHLLRMFLSGPNVVVLDEPTNDLDIDTLNVLEDVLDTWPGTLVVVSHDRYFLERVCDDLYLLADGRLRHLPGGVGEYLRGSAAPPPLTGRGAGAAEVGDAPASDAGGVAEGPAEPAVSPADQRAARKRMAAIERRLAAVASKVEKLHQDMAAAATHPGRLAELTAKESALSAEAEALEIEWLDLAESAE